MLRTIDFSDAIDMTEHLLPRNTRGRTNINPTSLVDPTSVTVVASDIAGNIYAASAEGVQIDPNTRLMTITVNVAVEGFHPYTVTVTDGDIIGLPINSPYAQLFHALTGMVNDVRSPAAKTERMKIIEFCQTCPKVWGECEGCCAPDCRRWQELEHKYVDHLKIK